MYTIIVTIPPSIADDDSYMLPERHINYCFDTYQEAEEYFDANRFNQPMSGIIPGYFPNRKKKAKVVDMIEEDSVVYPFDKNKD